MIKNDLAPADIVLLSVGNEEHQCYINASEILGENNLKIKSPIKETQVILDSINLDQASLNLNMLNDDLFVSHPSKAFKSFQGRAKILANPRTIDITIQSLIFRDMKIVNTPWIIGIVAYAGIDTKIWINNLVKPKKYSYLNQIMDKWML